MRNTIPGEEMASNGRAGPRNDEEVLFLSMATPGVMKSTCSETALGKV